MVSSIIYILQNFLHYTDFWEVCEYLYNICADKTDVQKTREILRPVIFRLKIDYNEPHDADAEKHAYQQIYQQSGAVDRIPG